MIACIKITVLKSSLQHGLFIRPEKYETFAAVEDIYDWIVCQDIWMKDIRSKYLLQTTLTSFTYSYLDLDVKNFKVDQGRIKLSRSLKRRCMVRKLC